MRGRVGSVVQMATPPGAQVRATLPLRGLCLRSPFCPKASSFAQKLAAWLLLVGIVAELMVTHAVGSEHGSNAPVSWDRRTIQTAPIVPVAKFRVTARAEAVEISNLAPDVQNERVSAKAFDLIDCKNAILRPHHFRPGRDDIASEKPLLVDWKITTSSVRTHLPVDEPRYVSRWQIAHVVDADIRNAVTDQHVVVERIDTPPERRTNKPAEGF